MHEDTGDVHLGFLRPLCAVATGGLRPRRGPREPRQASGPPPFVRDKSNSLTTRLQIAEGG